jgi:hypothetical protein
MADDTVTIAEIEKNRRETLRVTLGTFKEHRLCQMRVWAGSNGEAVPTKSGFAIQTHLIADLRAALDRAEAKARELGWLDGGVQP